MYYLDINLIILLSKDASPNTSKDFLDFLETNRSELANRI